MELESRRDPGSSVLPHFGPYHYGSHYSNSGIVAHYLVRLAPFTIASLKYQVGHSKLHLYCRRHSVFQDNAFDIADRLFHSMELTWRLASAESTTDFKELIPEFFTLPDFFLNQQGLELGTRQGGKVVNDVDLPPWVPNGDPRLFIKIHRQALESQHVTANLHSWIDLIFGYKQSGPAAVQALNVFHPATYQGNVDLVPGGDEVTRSALATMVRTYGQMPRQLFSSPLLPPFRSKNPIQTKAAKGPLQSVSGLRWGHYLGSPANGSDAPIVVLKQRAGKGSKPVSLALLPDATVTGLPSKTQLIHRARLSRQGLGSVLSNSEIEFVGFLSWAHGDGVLRGRILTPQPGGPWTALVAMHQEEITCSGYSTDGSRLFLGLKSGAVSVYRLEMNTSTIRWCRLEQSLIGHQAPISAIDICPAHQLAFTGDTEGGRILWDLSSLKFERSLTGKIDAVTHLLVCPTSADLISVSSCGEGSRMSVETVNGLHVGSVQTTSRVTAAAVTSLPEGTAVNAVAVALQDGLIRLYELWTLSVIREITHPSNTSTFVGLTFADGCKKLYAAAESGVVFCWEDSCHKHPKPPRYAPLTMA